MPSEGHTETGALECSWRQPIPVQETITVKDGIGEILDTDGHKA
jgi:hypothetical protein